MMAYVLTANGGIDDDNGDAHRDDDNGDDDRGGLAAVDEGDGNGDGNGNDGDDFAGDGDGASVDDVAMVLMTVHVFKGDYGGDVGCATGDSFEAESLSETSQSTDARSEALSTSGACGNEAPEPHFHLLAPLRRPIDE